MGKKRGKTSKKPVLPIDLPTPKIPHWLGPPNIEAQHLAWRFSNADLVGPFHCSNFSLVDFRKMWDRLRAFEGMNYSSLKRAKSLHEVPVPQLSREAKERLRALKLDDIDTMYSFHIDGPCRMWCMKHQNIFSILWWDRDHGGYIVRKRHT